MRSSWWLVIVALIIGGAVLWWRWRSDDAPDEPGGAGTAESARRREPEARRPAPVTEPSIGSPAATTAPAGERDEGRGAPLAYDASSTHVYDPCRAAIAPSIPAGYDHVTLGGVTVAWQAVDPATRQPFDAALDPAMLAGAAAGILEQAALATGTERRGELTIVVYPSAEDLRARTGLPAWADGLYDGGAVRVPLRPRDDLGVVLSTLRHELMHAQLHDRVGCVPAWFNEGIAMYFAGTPPTREWLAMLRHPEAFDVAALQREAIDDKDPERARRLYAQSLALVVQLAERTGDGALRQAAQEFHADGKWDAHYPQLDGRAVLDALARKIFGLGLGSELDAALAGVVCCYGLKTVSEFGCRTGTARPGEHTWRDTRTMPAAWCSDRW